MSYDQDEVSAANVEDGDSAVIDIGIRKHKYTGQLVVSIEQGEDIIVIPVETETLAAHLGHEIGKAIATYGSGIKLVKDFG